MRSLVLALFLAISVSVMTFATTSAPQAACFAVGVGVRFSNGNAQCFLNAQLPLHLTNVVAISNGPDSMITIDFADTGPNPGDHVLLPGQHKSWTTPQNGSLHNGG